MKPEKKTIHANLKREVRDAAESYFIAITDTWPEETRQTRARYLAKVALRLHIFEQGRRSTRP
jgi:hypothetical protein